MMSIDAETIAEQLIILFSRLGVPKEILTDQGSNFMSRLLQKLYQRLHITSIHTSPYHPQTDGLVERFNQTLKSMIMLRRFVGTGAKNWERELPYLLFAYREVPQASTGFSTFELLFGRHARGPLDVLKEDRSSERAKPVQSVVSHVLNVRERLEQYHELSRQNLTVAQQQQKMWYDTSSRERKFQVGDNVLVLLPTDSKKLPYPVTRCVSPVDYEVNMFDRRKMLGVFHVNMLRQWHTPSAAPCYQVEICEEEEIESLELFDKGQEDSPVIGEDLTMHQREEVTALIDKYAVTFSNQPGRTDVIEHRIDTGMAVPSRQMFVSATSCIQGPGT